MASQQYPTQGSYPPPCAPPPYESAPHDPAAAQGAPPPGYGLSVSSSQTLFPRAELTLWLLSSIFVFSQMIIVLEKLYNCIGCLIKLHLFLVYPGTIIYVSVRKCFTVSKLDSHMVSLSVLLKYAGEECRVFSE